MKRSDERPRARWLRKRAVASMLLIGIVAVAVPLIALDQVRADSFPSAPSNVQVFANPPGQVCASWNPIDGANQYRIFDASGNYIVSAGVAITPKCLPDAIGNCLMVSAVTPGGETARSAPACVGGGPSGPVTYPTPILYPTPIPVATPVPPAPVPQGPVYVPPAQPAVSVPSNDPPPDYVPPDPPLADPTR